MTFKSHVLSNLFFKERYTLFILEFTNKYTSCGSHCSILFNQHTTILDLVLDFTKKNDSFLSKKAFPQCFLHHRFCAHKRLEWFMARIQKGERKLQFRDNFPGPPISKSFQSRQTCAQPPLLLRGFVSTASYNSHASLIRWACAPFKLLLLFLFFKRKFSCGGSVVVDSFAWLKLEW